MYMCIYIYAYIYTYACKYIYAFACSESVQFSRPVCVVYVCIDMCIYAKILSSSRPLSLLQIYMYNHIHDCREHLLTAPNLFWILKHKHTRTQKTKRSCKQMQRVQFKVPVFLRVENPKMYKKIRTENRHTIKTKGAESGCRGFNSSNFYGPYEGGAHATS